jgi:hypothetical protein
MPMSMIEIRFGEMVPTPSTEELTLRLGICHAIPCNWLATWGSSAGHQLSAKIKMPQQKDLRFVRGELAPGRLSLAGGLQRMPSAPSEIFVGL